MIRSTMHMSAVVLTILVGTMGIVETGWCSKGMNKESKKKEEGFVTVSEVSELETDDKKLKFKLSPKGKEIKSQLSKTQQLIEYLNTSPNLRPHILNGVTYKRMLDKIAMQESEGKLHQKKVKIVDTQNIDSDFEQSYKRYTNVFTEKPFTMYHDASEVITYMKENPFIIHFWPETQDYKESYGYDYPLCKTNFFLYSTVLKGGKEWNTHNVAINPVSFFDDSTQVTILSSTKWIPDSIESADFLKLMLKQAASMTSESVVVLLPAWIRPGQYHEAMNKFYERIVEVAHDFYPYFKKIIIINCRNEFGAECLLLCHLDDSKNTKKQKNIAEQSQEPKRSDDDDSSEEVKTKYINEKKSQEPSRSDDDDSSEEVKTKHINEKKSQEPSRSDDDDSSDDVETISIKVKVSKPKKRVNPPQGKEKIDDDDILGENKAPIKPHIAFDLSNLPETDRVQYVKSPERNLDWTPLGEGERKPDANKETSVFDLFKSIKLARNTFDPFNEYINQNHHEDVPFLGRLAWLLRHNKLSTVPIEYFAFSELKRIKPKKTGSPFFEASIADSFEKLRILDSKETVVLVIAHPKLPGGRVFNKDGETIGTGALLTKEFAIFPEFLNMSLTPPNGTSLLQNLYFLKGVQSLKDPSKNINVVTIYEDHSNGDDEISLDDKIYYAILAAHNRGFKNIVVRVPAGVNSTSYIKAFKKLNQVPVEISLMFPSLNAKGQYDAKRKELRKRVTDFKPTQDDYLRRKANKKVEYPITPTKVQPPKRRGSVTPESRGENDLRKYPTPPLPSPAARGGINNNNVKPGIGRHQQDVGNHVGQRKVQPPRRSASVTPEKEKNDAKTQRPTPPPPPAADDATDKKNVKPVIRRQQPKKRTDWENPDLKNDQKPKRK